MLEHRFQKQVVYLLRLNGFLVLNTDVMIALRFLKTQKDRMLFIKDEKALGYFVGQSDLIVVLKNRVVFVELKTEKGKQRKMQKKFQKEVESLGYQYLLINNIDQVTDFINKNKKEKWI